MNQIHPNIVAYLALLTWPAVALYLYSTLPFGRATIWTILGGYLLLPPAAEIKFNMIPAFDKVSIPNLVALVACIFFARRAPKIFREFGLVELLLAALIFGPFVTSMLNTDPIQIESTHLPGVGPYDALSAAVLQLIVLIPFFIGRQFLRNAEDAADVLRALAAAGLIYSIPMLFEIRMSPQLNSWIYGYFPTSFDQEFRDGGWRPVVFLGHGLFAAFFIMTAVVAAAALWRTRSRILKVAPGGVTAYLGVVLILCKTMSAFLYALVAVPMVRWASPNAQRRVASVLVIFALSYPILRIADLVPTTAIIQLVRDVDVNRAASLETRFVNEEQLLNRAWERKWFGWGRYGRNRVYEGWQGSDSSLTDGAWIIQLGVFGLVGFAAEFGLLGLSVFRAVRSLKFVGSVNDRQFLSALVLIVAINIFDLIPNSSITPWTWLLAGSLLGRAEALRVEARSKALARRRGPPRGQIPDSQHVPT